MRQIGDLVATYAAPLVTILHSAATSVKSTWSLSVIECKNDVCSYLSVDRPFDTTDQEFELVFGAHSHRHDVNSSQGNLKVDFPERNTT